MDDGLVVAGMGGLEAALAATEERVDAALKATAAVTRELKKAKTGAERGQLRDLRRALIAATTLAGDAARAAENAGGPSTLTSRSTWSPAHTPRSYSTLRPPRRWPCSRPTSGCFATHP